MVPLPPPTSLGTTGALDTLTRPPHDDGSSDWAPPAERGFEPLPPTPGPGERREEGPPPRRRRRWWIPLLIVAALLVSTVIGASLITVPYYGIAPGDARPVAPRIQVDGAQTFATEDQILFVTVSIPHLTALGAVVGWLDPNVDVVPEKAILGTETPSENRQTNLRLMGYSKDFATYVALERLGFDVTVTGGGVVVDSLCMQYNADNTCAKTSPAAAVLKPHDLITAINKRPVELPPDIATALTALRPGEKVTVTITRSGAKPKDVPVTLTKGQDGRTLLGIVPDDSPPDTVRFQFPVQVSINSGAVGGPSAGLAFTLALLDALTPGDLTGGKKVAATGTISPSGNIGPIGGLRQKTVAVQRQGAELFVVPRSEMKDAVDQAKGTKLKVVGVDTLDQALAALRSVGGAPLPAPAVRGT